jgi:predicted amino acid racemase
MNRFPRILIDTGKVIANFQRIAERARRAGINITGVLIPKRYRN